MELSQTSGCTGAGGNQHGQSAFAAHAQHALPNGDPMEASALSNGGTPSQPPHPASYMEVSQRSIVPKAQAFDLLCSLKGVILLKAEKLCPTQISCSCQLDASPLLCPWQATTQYFRGTFCLHVLEGPI